MSKSIQISLWLAQAFKWLLILLIGLFVGFIILILIKSDITQNYLVELDSSTRLLNIYKCIDCTNSSTAFFVNKLSISMILWLFVQFGVVCFSLFRIVQQIIRILKNFGSLKTFYEGNIVSFRKMGFYALIMVPFLAFKYISYYDPVEVHAYDHMMMNIPFGQIAFSLACFVLADVFEEGKKLKEDSESIL